MSKADKPWFWHSAPLTFAVVPVFAGFIFQNGGTMAMDIVLLGYGSLFLNWCLKKPWEWYHAAQQIRYLDPEEAQGGNATIEEDDLDQDSEVLVSSDSDSHPSEAAKSADQPRATTSRKTTPTNAVHEAAHRTLRKNEMLALAACFVSPLLGAYILHVLRSALTRPAEGLVSDLNLTIFVIAAELRPVSHIIQLYEARILHLQRVVRSDHESKFRKADIQELFLRLADIESRVTPTHNNVDVEDVKLRATVHQSIQPQLDALNRAVRRYEKRQTIQAMQIEARFQALDSRSRDTLALAAAAARNGQRPGNISILLTRTVNFVKYGVQTIWAVVTYPFRMVTDIVTCSIRTVAEYVIQVEAWFTGENRLTRKRVKRAE
jgi:hypothetical protein